MSLSDVYGRRANAPTEREATDLIHRALDLGVTLFDTAEMYGPFVNEELVGRALAGRREHAVIATKFGLKNPGEWPVQRNRDGRPETARRSCEASLRRLGVDVIDLYYLHRVDQEIPIEETVGAMAELVEAGKVGHIGVCEPTAAELRRAHGTYPVTAVQSEWSLWSRDIEQSVVLVCRELGVGVVPYSPLGVGFLAGRFSSRDDLGNGDGRRGLPRLSEENFAANRAVVARLESLASQRGITAGQLALAWLLAQGDDIVPIPSTKRAEYLEENVAAASVELSASELAEIDEAAPPSAFVGGREPAGASDQ